MHPGTAFVVGLFAAGALGAGAYLVSERKREEETKGEAQNRAAMAEQELAYLRSQQQQRPYPTQASNTGGALNGVANVLQSLGGGSGVSALLSLALNK